MAPYILNYKVHIGHSIWTLFSSDPLSSFISHHSLYKLLHSYHLYANWSSKIITLFSLCTRSSLRQKYHPTYVNIPVYHS